MGRDQSDRGESSREKTHPNNHLIIQQIISPATLSPHHYSSPLPTILAHRLFARHTHRTSKSSLANIHTLSSTPLHLTQLTRNRVITHHPFFLSHPFIRTPLWYFDHPPPSFLTNHLHPPISSHRQTRHSFEHPYIYPIIDPHPSPRNILSIRTKHPTAITNPSLAHPDLHRLHRKTVARFIGIGSASTSVPWQKSRVPPTPPKINNI